MRRRVAVAGVLAGVAITAGACATAIVQTRSIRAARRHAATRDRLADWLEGMDAPGVVRPELRLLAGGKS